MADKIKNIAMVSCTIIMTVIAVGGIIYACGSVTGDIKETKEDVATVTTDVKVFKEKVSKNIEELEDDVHRIELDAKDIKSLAVSSGEAAQRSADMFEKIQDHMAEMDKRQAINTEILKTLTKDE